MPPVVGMSATSPRSVPNVERSSWANCLFRVVSFGYVIRKLEHVVMRACYWGYSIHRFDKGRVEVSGR
jgi:hypothetical protein